MVVQVLAKLKLVGLAAVVQHGLKILAQKYVGMVEIFTSIFVMMET